MSEERAIRLNKVLRELNISLDRAVDFLKDKGHIIEASPNAKISGTEYNALFSQFSADQSKKAASLEVSEEKRKEKEALRIERERELEEKKKQEEEKQRHQQEVIRARASLSGPVAVGKIDLNPKKPETATAPSDNTAAAKPEAQPKPQQQAESPVAVAAEQPVEAPKPVEVPQPQAEKPAPVIQAPVQAEKPAAPKQQEAPAPKPAQQQPVQQQQQPKPKQAEEAAPAPQEKIETQYQKLTGTTFTGQKIDLSQFESLKRRKKISVRIITSALVAVATSKVADKAAITTRTMLTRKSATA